MLDSSRLFPLRAPHVANERQSLRSAAIGLGIRTPARSFSLARRNGRCLDAMADVWGFLLLPNQHFSSRRSISWLNGAAVGRRVGPDWRTGGLDPRLFKSG